MDENFASETEDDPDDINTLTGEDADPPEETGAEPDPADEQAAAEADIDGDETTIDDEVEEGEQ